MKDYQFNFPPTLMQRLAVVKLKQNHFYANWCGTGAGKTNATLLATRQLDCKNTVIICPNSVRESWVEAIKKIYPNNTNIVNYNKIKDIETFDRNVFNYIIISYEKFQIDNKNQGIPLINKLLSLNKIDFLCIDEIHWAKACSTEAESNRRERIKFLRMEAQNQNPDLYVYGMTATPVINNIGEAKSLIELITGEEHSEIGNKTQLNNCYQANKWLNIIGFRYIPDYGINVTERIIEINGIDYVNDIVESNTKSPVDIEAILTEIKLNDENVIAELTPGSIIYCQFKKGIVKKITDKLTDLDISYIKYTGDESDIEREQNKKLFINKKADILVATKPISTGVDGLQQVSNKLIIFSYPWTGAEWQQLVGRINRQGSIFSNTGITIVHPRVFIPTSKGEWNYDLRRWNIIKNKNTLSDVVVDGHLDAVYKLNRGKFVKQILTELKENRLTDFHPQRNKLEVKYEFSEQEYKTSESVIKDIHKKANTSTHQHMHEHFIENPNDWREYHKQREIAKSKWDEDPVDVIANELNNRNDDNIIADLGCGLAKLSKLVREPNKVISVDHFSDDKNVIKADIADLSEHINDKEVDITVFCLSLWGTNYLDYIKEAYRITAKRGFMYIVEPKDKFDFDELKKNIHEIGFEIKEEKLRGKFNYLTFIKN